MELSEFIQKLNEKRELYKGKKVNVHVPNSLYYGNLDQTIEVEDIESIENKDSTITLLIHTTKAV